MYARIVALARILREENFAVLIWVTLVNAMAVAFAQRIAPLQVWWSMKYHACDFAEIDARMALEHVVLRKRMEGHDWLTIGNASSEWLDPGLAPAARALRARYPADRVVAACIGREEKLDSPEFLGAVATLLQRHPEAVFIWTGREQRASIQGHFERAGRGRSHRLRGWGWTRGSTPRRWICSSTRSRSLRLQPQGGHGRGQAERYLPLPREPERPAFPAASARWRAMRSRSTPR